MTKKTDTVVAKITGKNVSDGCTNSPDFNFYPCCAEHDWYYSNNSDIPRLHADILLFLCIYKSGHTVLALFYFYMVRKFGESHYENYSE